MSLWQTTTLLATETAQSCAAAPVIGRSTGFEVAVDCVTNDVANLAVLVSGDPTDALVGVIIEPDAQARGVARPTRQGGASRTAAGKPRRIESLLGFVCQGLLIFSN
jgi:hypothetical protein